MTRAEELWGRNPGWGWWRTGWGLSWDHLGRFRRLQHLLHLHKKKIEADVQAFVLVADQEAFGVLGVSRVGITPTSPFVRGERQHRVYGVIGTEYGGRWLCMGPRTEASIVHIIDGEV